MVVFAVCSASVVGAGCFEASLTISEDSITEVNKIFVFHKKTLLNLLLLIFYHVPNIKKKR